ncbi:MAG TPA: hypothetical protein VID51_04190 [Solirubrobacterales bacterium]|jgi:uncharacterized delta-60 repeat protein
MSATALAHPGDLDPSFGRGGRVLAPVRIQNQASGYLSAHNWMGTAVATAVAPGGRVVVAGERTVVAFRRDGKVDRRFGSNGRVNLPLMGEGQTIVKDVAVDPGGHIFVLAAARFANGGGLAIVARLSASGELDTSFADNGILLTDFGLPAPQSAGPSAPPPEAPTDVLPADLVVDGEGRLVVAGTAVAIIAPCRGAGEQPHHAAYLARLLPDGSLDTDFGKGGVVLDERSPFYLEQHPYMGGIAIHGGAILYATDKNDTANCEGFGGGLLVRLDESGTRDPGFGSAGVLDVTPSASRPLHIAVDRWGRILVIRSATAGETESLAGFEVVSRRNADGTLDTGFGHGGEIAVKLPGETSGLDALAVDARGRPLLAGGIAPPRTPSQVKRHVFAPPKFALIRLSASGRPDPTFGRQGRVVTGFGHGSRAAATDIAIRGKSAIVAGPVLSGRIHSGRGFALVRYRLGP